MFSETYMISSADQIKLSAFFSRLYAWMAGALVLSAFVAWGMGTNPQAVQFLTTHINLLYLAIVAELVVVILLSAMLHRISVTTAILGFMLYAALTGFTLSIIFLVYTAASITTTFLVTAGSFGALSLYGFTTRSNLGAWGGFLIMSLIGMIIASLINLFLHSAMVQWILTYAGVIIFAGLTAYDTQKLKAMCLMSEGEGLAKLAVYGALNLYLDFINLFLHLLQLFGRRK